MTAAFHFATLRRVSTRVYDCPQCGGVVQFNSSIAVFAVCSYCRSMVVRRDAGIESLGIMAELPPDLSPLQLGTRGEWQGTAFVLLGRLRVEWEAGSWNEWYAEFTDGRNGWIAETQGFFAISFETSDPALPAAPAQFQPSQSIDLQGRMWKVIDVKTATCLAGEGELPFVSPPGQKRTGVDLMGKDGAFATVEFHDGEEPQLYLGAYAEFEALDFSNLRPVPGWSAEAETTRYQTIALNCPSCAAAVTLRAAGQSMAAVCGSCGAVIDTADPQWKLIQAADEKVRELRVVLPIGARGRFREIEYEVIGFVRRADKYSTWQEYLLFNPWRGFRWLVTYNGHWSFVSRLLELPIGTRKPRLRDGREFELFAKGDAQVTAVLGEFYWKVERGEQAALSDYIRPPEVLSRESYPGLQEETWSTGTYVEPEEVASAFGVKKLPKPTGYYLNQPNPHTKRRPGIRRAVFVFVALYLAIQALSAIGRRKEPLTEVRGTYRRAEAPAATAASSVQLERDEAARTIVSERFELRGRPQPVTIRAFAPVDNNWIALDFDLVNAKTNERFPAVLEIAQYSGSDGGERWSEGSAKSKATIPAIPPGEYFLTVDAGADAMIAEMPWHARVEGGGLFWSNFWLGLTALLTYPAWVFWRSRAFEHGRWAESDFVPGAIKTDRAPLP